MNKHRAVVTLTCLVFLLCSIAHADVLNGGFETGNLTGWTSSGNGSVQVLMAAQFAPFSPTEGSFFALIGNGPSDVGFDGAPDTGILTSDPFVVPAGGTTLQFDWNFLTAEFTGTSADPARLDSFTISLIPSVGPGTMLESGNVSLGTFSLIGGGGATAPDGTSVLEHLGFRTGSVNLAPGTYSIQFRVDDAGDGSFDSALLVDRVRFTVIPEPSTLLTVVIGLGGLLCSARAKTRRK